MSYDGWMEYNGVEVVNRSRTAQLARALGISIVRTPVSSVQWIEDTLDGADYDDVTTAPWYDAGFPASAEFAGFIPLSISGLDDSSRESTPVEYITDGGNSGRSRNATQPLVWNLRLVATSDRGAEYGKRWLDRILSDSGSNLFCTGADLRYFRHEVPSVELGWASMPVVNPNGASDTTAWDNPPLSVVSDAAPGGGPETTALAAQALTGFGRDFAHDPIPVHSVLGGPQHVRASVWVYVTGSGDDLLVQFHRANADASDTEFIGGPVTVNAGTGWQQVSSAEFDTTETHPYVYVSFTLEATASTAHSWVTKLAVERYTAINPAPVVHRRNVRLTRGSSVTLKRRGKCSVLWGVTLTMTAADPFEYGEEVDQFTELGGFVTGDGVDSSGSLVLVEEDCPVFDYTPVYDPLYPALVASPTAPDFLPDGWTIVAGATFERFWTRLNVDEPATLNVVPIITLTCPEEARMVRFSLWPSDSETSDQCDPLFSVVVAYLPAGLSFVVDGERKASYVWDGFSPSVRRTDSLVYSPDAGPVQWAALNDSGGLLATLDVFVESGVYSGDGFVRAALSLVPKSD